MTSTLLNPEKAVAGSASAQQLEKYQAAKQRPRYSFPEKATHLSDRAARQSEHKLQSQFFKSARSITPPLDAVNYVPKNYVLLSHDGTKAHARHARPKRTANKVLPDDAATAPTTLRILTAHGGSPAMHKVMAAAIGSGRFNPEVKDAIFEGQFDNYIEEYLRRRNGLPLSTTNQQSLQSNITIDTINTAEELESKTKAFVESREIPEKHKTTEQLAADPNIGASSECITFDTM